MKYKVIRTDTADAGIRKIILYVAQNFGNSVALEKLDEIEKRILELGDDPYIGTDPRYLVLKRQRYKVLILEKDLVFCICSCGSTARLFKYYSWIIDLTEIF